MPPQVIGSADRASSFTFDDLMGWLTRQLAAHDGAAPDADRAMEACGVAGLLFFLRLALEQPGLDAATREELFARLTSVVRFATAQLRARPSPAIYYLQNWVLTQRSHGHAVTGSQICFMYSFLASVFEATEPGESAR